MPAKKKTTRRIRPRKNITISEEAAAMGEALAKSKGLKFSQLVERLVRTELVKAGKLPPGSE